MLDIDVKNRQNLGRRSQILNPIEIDRRAAREAANSTMVAAPLSASTARIFSGTFCANFSDTFGFGFTMASVIASASAVNINSMKPVESA